MVLGIAFITFQFLEYYFHSEEEEGKRWLPNENVRELSEYVQEWQQLGANWIGNYFFLPLSLNFLFGNPFLVW